MNTYYRLISCQGRLVVFTDASGKRDTRSLNDFLNNGFLEFFSQDDTTRILAKAYASNLGDVLSRIGNSKVWVPYRRYVYYPVFSFMTFGSLLSSHFLTQQHIIFRGEALYGSFFVLPLPFIFTDLINELFGYDVAKRMLQNSALLLFIIAGFIYSLKNIIVLFHCEHNMAWLNVNENMHVILAVNAFALLCADLLNAWIFHKLRMWSGNHYFGLRSFLSTSISQVMYSLVVFTVFTGCGWSRKYQSFDLEALLFLFNNFQIKLAYSLTLLPVMYWICRCIKTQDFKILHQQMREQILLQRPLPPQPLPPSTL